jgi:hypothetical protein
VESGKEVDGASIVACGDVSEVLELVEEAFDAVAQSIGDPVVRYLDLAGDLGGDDGRRLGVTDEFAQGIVVIGLVGDDAGRGAAIEEVGGGGAIESSIRLGNAPQPDLWPPFSARRLLVDAHHGGIEHEILVVGIGVSESNTPSHTPALAQRVKRLWTDLYLPYRSGKSSHRAPDRKIHKTPFTNNRLSSPLQPGSPTLPGNSGASCSHWSSETSYRLTIAKAPDRRIWSPMSHTFRPLGILNVDRT